MSAKPDAIGYLRRDISGIRQTWDENRIRSLAKRFGYNLRKTIVFGPTVDYPVQRLCNVVKNLEVVTVFVPNPAHFPNTEVPAALVQICDVITVDDQHTYARWSTGALPAELSDARPHAGWHGGGISRLQASADAT